MLRRGAWEPPFRYPPVRLAVAVAVASPMSTMRWRTVLAASHAVPGTTVRPGCDKAGHTGWADVVLGGKSAPVRFGTSANGRVEAGSLAVAARFAHLHCSRV